MPNLVLFLFSKMIWGFGANAPFRVRHVYAETMKILINLYASFLNVRYIVNNGVFRGSFWINPTIFGLFLLIWTKLDSKLDFVLAVTNSGMTMFFIKTLFLIKKCKKILKSL